MAAVYILLSEKLNRFYIGSCLDLDLRLSQYFNKEFSTSFTSTASDWKLFYFLDNLHYEQSRSIEKHIKNMKSVAYIRNLKLYPEIAIRLIELYK